MTPDHADFSLLLPAAAFGLIFGSFATALSYRLPRGESIAKGRSKCAACGHTLSAPDLVPVFSWIAHRGKCRHCGERISWRYPAIEMVMAGLFVAVVFSATGLLHMAVLLAMTFVGLTLAVTDLEHQRLPDSLVMALGALALIWRWADNESLLIGLLSATLIFTAALLLDMGFKRLLHRPGLGMGDAKLFAVAGLALTPGALLIFFCVAGALGVAMGVLWRLRTGAAVFPFAPAILMAFWLALLAGHNLLQILIILRFG